MPPRPRAMVVLAGARWSDSRAHSLTLTLTLTLALVHALALAPLTGCGAAPAGALQARSALGTGCRPARELRIDAHRPGDPRQNLPERWTVTGCGRTHACASFLMTSGEAAHTECTEVEGSVVRRLQAASARVAAAAAACPPKRVQVQGRLALELGTSYVFLVQACGRAYRCLTAGVRGERESATRCEELRAPSSGRDRSATIDPTRRRGDKR